MNLTLQYPYWYLLFCAALAGGITYLLYFIKDDFSELNKWLKRGMALFRFSLLFIICILLLSPLISTNHREVQKPKVVILRDNSGSITTLGNANFYEKQFPDKLNELKNSLSEKYEVKAFSFANTTEEDKGANYTGKLTNIAQAFQDIKDVYSNQNLGAVILASDGIYNQGANPNFIAKDLVVPVFTIGLGDTVPKKDLLIAGISQNKYAYLGNNFPVEITVEGKLMNGVSTVLKVSDDAGNIQFTQAINVVGERFQKKIGFTLKAQKPGIAHYNVTLETVKDEVTKANNRDEFFVEILDGRQKVLLLYANPHPDIAALKNAIEENENYEVEVASASEFKKKTEGFNLVILHNIPSTQGAGQNVVQELIKNDVPVLYILGSNSAFQNFNQLAVGLNVNIKSNTVNESQPTVNHSFNLFTLSAELNSQIEHFPPLLAPFGDFKMTNSAQSLLFQKIGSITTEKPLIVFSQQENRKTGIIVGENIWKWRLADFYQNESHKLFDDLMSKIVQYLAVKQDKSQFRIITKNKYLENESVIFEGEVYNDSYELINSSEISLVVSDTKGKKYPFVLGKTSSAYRLDAGIFPPGSYTYEATTRLSDKVQKIAGKFLVSEIKLEFAVTQADHQLLRTLSKSTNGQYFPKEKFDEIGAILLKSEKLKPVIYNYAAFDEAIHLKWICILLLLLLSVEWFLRKWAGGY